MPLIDNDQFRALNGDVKIVKGKANSWVILLKEPTLVRVYREHGERGALEMATDYAVDWWKGLTNDLIDVPDLRATGMWPASTRIPQAKGRVQVQPWPIELDPDQYLFVAIEFTPGVNRKVRWPWFWGVFGDWYEPTSGVIATYDPFQSVHVPTAVESMGTAAQMTADQLRDEAAAAAAAAGKKAAELAKKLGAAALVGVAIAGFVLVLVVNNKVRS